MNETSSTKDAICRAIRRCLTVQFVYEGRLRVVHPYCHGVTRTGHDALRAVQVGGASSSKSGFGFGKLWTLAKMTQVRVLDRSFDPNDPHYNPDDSAFAHIHCRVQRAVSVPTRHA
jgi:hypothetical protein